MPSTPPRPRVVRGQVSPRRAAPYFLPRECGAGASGMHVGVRATAGPPAPRTTPPLWRRATLATGPNALWAHRTRRTFACIGLQGRIPPIDTRAYLDAFSSDPEAYYVIESACIEHASAGILSATYTHAAAGGSGVQYLAVGDDEGRVHLLDTSIPPRSLGDSACKLSTRPLVDGAIFELQWRADDRVLALGSGDYGVSAWDVEHELCVARFDRHAGSPRTLAWAPGGSGRLLASAGRDGDIYLWDLRTEEPAAHIAHAHGRLAGGRRGRALPAGVTSLAYVDDHQLASAGCADATVKLWDMRMLTRRPRPRPRAASADLSRSGGNNTRPHGISSLAVSHTQRRIYAACTDGGVYGLQASLDGGETRMYSDTQALNTLYSRIALCDDRFLAVGCCTGAVALWDTMSLSPHPRILHGHATNAEVNAVAWATSWDGPSLASVSDDQTVRVWQPSCAGSQAPR